MTKKTVSKREFCHNVTRFLKEGQDLEIKGRNFGASLIFDKPVIGIDPGSPDGDNQAVVMGRQKPDGSLHVDKVIVKKSPAVGITTKDNPGHAQNCPCLMCKPPKKKSA